LEPANSQTSPKTKAGDTAPASIASRAQTTAAIHREWRSDTRPLTFSCRARAGDAGGGRGASNIDAIGPVNSRLIRQRAYRARLVALRLTYPPLTVAPRPRT